MLTKRASWLCENRQDGGWTRAPDLRSILVGDDMWCFKDKHMVVRCSSAAWTSLACKCGVTVGVGCAFDNGRESRGDRVESGDQIVTDGWQQEREI